MLPFIEAQRAAIAELCRRFHVRRLDVFGSAARGTDFDPSRSDVDLLVSYHPGRIHREFRPRISLYSECSVRPVLAIRSISSCQARYENPFIRAGIERSQAIALLRA